MLNRKINRELAKIYRLSMDRTERLKHILYDYEIDGYIVPATDPYQNEYVHPCYLRLPWLTNFTGSMGVAIVLSDKAAFFTDGRYMVQAKKQLDTNIYEIYNIKDLKPWEWVEKFAKDLVIGYDPLLHTKANIEKYPKTKAVNENIIDRLWYDKPEPPSSDVMEYPLKYAGEDTNSKIAKIIEVIEKSASEALILTLPDSICWLLNVRGSDVDYVPIILGYAIIYKDGNIEWFVENSRSSFNLPDNVTVYSSKLLEKRLNQLKDISILLDENTAPIWFLTKLDKIINHEDPCLILKACKNQIEISGMKKAHIQDGIAVTKFLYWLHKNVTKQKITEITAARKLLEFRLQGANFISPSFATIAGFAEHGAIVHYHAVEDTDIEIKGDNILLLDSGGQYLDGTTDITRTIAIGRVTNLQKRHFTLVLKGHIALAKAVFPAGTTGSALDILARQFLWQENLDYDHGTGHGVGCFLNVHEGPQRISKIPNNVALRPGMIISNEPGYYLEGSYGIRIENLVLVVEVSPNFYGFETITLAPLDLNLVDYSLLNQEEKAWLVNYQKQVIETLYPFLSIEERRWLNS